MINAQFCDAPEDWTERADKKNNIAPLFFHNVVTVTTRDSLDTYVRAQSVPSELDVVDEVCKIC